MTPHTVISARRSNCIAAGLPGFALFFCEDALEVTRKPMDENILYRRVDSLTNPLARASRFLPAATWVALLALLVVFSADSLAQDRESKQLELDEACEAVRQVRLTSDQARLTEECVENKEKEDRAACEQYYSDYSARRPARYYDLPECVEAFDFQRSQRSRGD